MLIEVIIPTYNRLNFLKETLTSVLKQQIGINCDLNIIISDNSINNETEDYFRVNTFNKVTYLRRTPPVSPLLHFQKILEEVRGDYFMIFHDDDVMCDDMLSSLIEAMLPDIVAVGCNAFLWKIPNKKELYSKKLSQSYVINNQQSLLKPYLERKDSVPFPGYLYRNLIGKVRLDTRYGKHLDVYLLSQVLKYGAVKILYKPYFYYRIHEGQDSFNSDFIGKSNLIRYIIENCNLTKKDKIVVRCRLYAIYDELRTQLLNSEHIDNHRIYRFIILCLKTFNVLIGLKMFFYMQKVIK